jgi:hypothetical protein
MRIAMNNMCRIGCVMVILAAARTTPAAAQDSRTARPETRLAVLDARLLPPAPGEANTSQTSHSDLSLAVGMTGARTRRPWWLLPLAAAGAGAVLFEVVRGDECEQADCTIYIPPPLQGAVLGLAVGTVIEVVLRASER